VKGYKPAQHCSDVRDAPLESGERDVAVGVRRGSGDEAAAGGDNARPAAAAQGARDAQRASR
jgi:hypothetical protein